MAVAGCTPPAAASGNNNNDTMIEDNQPLLPAARQGRQQQQAQPTLPPTGSSAAAAAAAHSTDPADSNGGASSEATALEKALCSFRENVPSFQTLIESLLAAAEKERGSLAEARETLEAEKKEFETECQRVQHVLAGV